MRTGPLGLDLATPATGGTRINAWRPGVPGIAEVFHAHFVDHAYPVHTHDAWSLLIVDDGAIRFDLDRHRHGAAGLGITLLPPNVPHDGQPATQLGFRKRVLYLDTSVLGEELVGTAVDEPSLQDPQLRDRIDRLHRVLAHPGDAFEAESRLAFIRERLWQRLSRTAPDPSHPPASREARGAGRPGGPAARLRELLDARTSDGVSLREAADLLNAHPTHLVRAFTQAYGLPPHRYLTGRRVDLARRLLLAGGRPAQVATAVGFYDQAHLNRHFKRYLGVSPARYAGSTR